MVQLFDEHVDCRSAGLTLLADWPSSQIICAGLSLCENGRPEWLDAKGARLNVKVRNFFRWDDSLPVSLMRFLSEDVPCYG